MSSYLWRVLSKKKRSVRDLCPVDCCASFATRGIAPALTAQHPSRVEVSTYCGCFYPAVACGNTAAVEGYNKSGTILRCFCRFCAAFGKTEGGARGLESAISGSGHAKWQMKGINISKVCFDVVRAIRPVPRPDASPTPFSRSRGLTPDRSSAAFSNSSGSSGSSASSLQPWGFAYWTVPTFPHSATNLDSAALEKRVAFPRPR